MLQLIALKEISHSILYWREHNPIGVFFLHLSYLNLLGSSYTMVNFVAQFSLLILKFLWCDHLVTSEHCKILNGLSSQKINAFYLSFVLMQKKVNKACKEAIIYSHNVDSSTPLMLVGFFQHFFSFLFFSLMNNAIKKYRTASECVDFDKQFCLKNNFKGCSLIAGHF